MTPRLYALVIVLAIALAALAASEHKATNNGLPLVASAMPTGDFPKRNMLFSPCPLTPRNLPQFTDDEEDHT